MKISKSKQELARIIIENGGWCDGAHWMPQDRDGGVYSFAGGKPVRHKDMWCLKSSSEKIGWKFAHAGAIKNWHQTILSRDEYFHLYPAPDADGWIEWKGGECPLESGTLVDIKDGDGFVWLAKRASPQGEYSEAGSEFWTWDCSDRNRIVAYRLHNPEQVKSTAVGDDETNLATKDELESMECKPSIEQLASDHRNAKDYAERKQEEADSAKADADARLAKLVAAGKVLGLAVSVAAPESEMVVTNWRDLREGDVIRCIGDAWGDDFEGREAVVARIESHDYKYELRICACIGEESDWGDDFHFIRRP